MQFSSSKYGAVYQNRNAAVVSGANTVLLTGAQPVVNAEGINIRFSMSPVAAWAGATVVVKNRGVVVWTFQDQLMDLLTPFYLFRQCRLGDDYSVELLQTSGANVEASVLVTIGDRVPVSV